MNIEKIKKQNYIIVFLSIILLVLLLFLINQQYQILEENKRNIVLQEEKTIVLEERLTKLIFIKEQLPRLQEKLGILEQLLPKNLQEQDIIRVVQEAVVGSNGKILEIRFNNIEQIKDYFQFPFQLVFEGNFYGLLQFLNNLNNQSSLISLDSFSIQVARGDNNIRADLRVIAFYLD